MRPTIRPALAFRVTTLAALAACATLAPIGASALAAPVVNLKPAPRINPARVVATHALVTEDIFVNVVVEDLGGSTDFSPTQKVWFTLYVKGEMASTDAAFNVAQVFGVKSVKRTGEGRAEIVVLAVDEKSDVMPVEKTLVIDWRSAEKAILAVDCGDEFDCAASENFRTRIDVSSR